MGWTRNCPKAPGRYLLKHLDIERLIHVKEDQETGEMVAYDNEDWLDWASQLYGEWLGPLICQEH
jgi:hypothetical protein